MTKEARIYKWRKNSLFNKWCWENWTATWKRMKLEHSLGVPVVAQWLTNLTRNHEVAGLVPALAQ